MLLSDEQIVDANQLFAHHSLYLPCRGRTTSLYSGAIKPVPATRGRPRTLAAPDWY
jgi:hypothetical protein